MPERTNAFSVAVPASSANLGPGFDAIGVALDLWVRATVQPSLEFSIAFKAGRYVPTNAGFENEILRGFDRVLHGARPKVSLTIANDIPLGKGLGASAAGAVLGLTVAAELAAERPSAEQLARDACELEGHPDNALPALLGGIIMAAMPENAAPVFLRFEPPAGLAVVAVVPHIVLHTAAARALLTGALRARRRRLQSAACRTARRRACQWAARESADGDRRSRAPALPGAARARF